LVDWIKRLILIVNIETIVPASVVNKEAMYHVYNFMFLLDT